MSKLLFKGTSWTISDIDRIWPVLHKIATEKYGLDYYDPQFELVTCDQMLQRMATSGRPQIYNHWSFGKSYEHYKKQWANGQANVPYEMIFHADPMPCYLMEDNSITLQTLVLAHAVCGHGSFFKGNYLMREWVVAKAVLPRITHAREYIKECERKYGVEQVEVFIDACHSLQYQGMDRYKRGRKHDAKKLKEKIKNRMKVIDESESYEFYNLNKHLTIDEDNVDEWPYPEENLLYFIEKNSPILYPWQREIIRIVRTQMQQFYPNMLTKLMNEGWASFWHYQLTKDLYDEGYINEGSWMEILHNHTNIACLPSDSVSGRFNPYALGFAIWTDLRRACENPTEEDYEYLPLVAGKPWAETLKWVMENFKDESFICEFLGPNVIKEFKLCAINDIQDEKEYEVVGVQDKSDVAVIRKSLSSWYTMDNIIPTVQVAGYHERGDRTLYLEYRSHDRRKLDQGTLKPVMKYVKKLWGLPVELVSVGETGDEIKLITKRRW